MDKRIDRYYLELFFKVKLKPKMLCKNLWNKQLHIFVDWQGFSLLEEEKKS